MKTNEPTQNSAPFLAAQEIIDVLQKYDCKNGDAIMAIAVVMKAVLGFAQSNIREKLKSAVAKIRADLAQNERLLSEKEWEALKDIIGLARGLKATHQEHFAKCFKAHVLIADLIDMPTEKGHLNGDDFNELVCAAREKEAHSQDTRNVAHECDESPKGHYVIKAEPCQS